MKARLFIIGLLLSALVACTSKVKVPEPVEGPSPELSAIDSLMWQQPDSALAVLIDYLDDDGRDVARYVSTNETFDNHYAQLLASELLFKNNYAQTNRRELLQAVGYFDSLLLAADGADTRGVSLRPDPRWDAPRASAKTTAFLAARAHYINGAGYYERDSLIEACGEYLNALRIMESHFAEGELVDKKARFMALTYSRLVDLFSKQFMQEPAIYCGKQALVYNEIAPTSPYGSSKILYRIGKQYDKLNVMDSASYYYDLALEYLPDRNDMVYRDIITSRALFEYKKDSIVALDIVKSMAAQAIDEAERLCRYLFIGIIYHESGLNDTAKAYLEPVFEKDPSRAALAAQILYDIALEEGDTIKSNSYAQFLIENAFVNAENQARVSKLNDLFQTYLQEKQATASLREQKKAVRTTLIVVLPLVVVLSAVVVILTRRRSKKRMATQEAEAQRRLSEVSQKLSEATQRHDEAERELQTKVEQAAQHTREMLQQRVTDIYQSNSKDRLQRILEAVDDTYPKAVAKLKSEHPELGETERNILLLNFLHFRIKEEADLLGLSENTVAKYRSNLGKTLGKDPIPDWI
jgi:tetratricopeptide (TPR) repeat protein